MINHRNAKRSLLTRWTMLCKHPMNNQSAANRNTAAKQLTRAALRSGHSQGVLRGRGNDQAEVAETQAQPSTGVLVAGQQAREARGSRGVSGDLGEASQQGTDPAR